MTAIKKNRTYRFRRAGKVGGRQRPRRPLGPPPPGTRWTSSADENAKWLRKHPEYKNPMSTLKSIRKSTGWLNGPAGTNTQIKFKKNPGGATEVYIRRKARPAATRKRAPAKRNPTKGWSLFHRNSTRKGALEEAKRIRRSGTTMAKVVKMDGWYAVYIKDKKGFDFGMT